MVEVACSFVASLVKGQAKLDPEEGQAFLQSPLIQRLVVAKLVVVAEVPVAFWKVRFWKVEEPFTKRLVNVPERALRMLDTNRLVVVAFVIVALLAV